MGVTLCGEPCPRCGRPCACCQGHGHFAKDGASSAQINGHHCAPLAYPSHMWNGTVVSDWPGMPDTYGRLPGEY